MRVFFPGRCTSVEARTNLQKRETKEKWLHRWVNVENEGGQPRTTKKSPKKAGDEVKEKGAAKGVKYNKVFESLRKDMSSCSLLRLE